MSSEILGPVLAWLPMFSFVVVLSILYAMTRKQPAQQAPLGKTYACAQCGRRGNHEHMVPVTHEGAVVWYCSRCSH